MTAPARPTIVSVDGETGEAARRPMTDAELADRAELAKRDPAKREGERAKQRAAAIAGARAKAGKGDTAGALADVLALLEQQA